ncbi:hypothetical protein PMAYCL1PPCAC_05404, partial [Pristionchus mayeri]
RYRSPPRMDRFRDLGIPDWNAEQKQFVVDVVSGVVIVCTSTTKTLIELGHEPFPLSRGKTITRRNAYLLPNAFSYAKQLAQSHPLGWRVLMTGYDAASISVITRLCTIRLGNKCFDVLFPPSVDDDDEELDLDDGQSFWRALRWAIRDSITHTVALIVARPFRVVAIRQIAQLVGGEAKYLNLFGGLRVIITEQGFKGLFAGVVVQLCAELVLIWGCAAVSYLAERALTRVYTGGPRMGFVAALDLPPYDLAEMAYHGTRNMVAVLTPRLGSSLLKPLFSASTVMACV